MKGQDEIGKCCVPEELQKKAGGICFSNVDGYCDCLVNPTQRDGLWYNHDTGQHFCFVCGQEIKGARALCAFYKSTIEVKQYDANYEGEYTQEEREKDYKDQTKLRLLLMQAQEMIHKKEENAKKRRKK